MPPPTWITLYEAYTRLQDMYLSLRVHEIVETAVKSRQPFVRGISLSGISLRSSYEIIGEQITKDAQVDVFSSCIRDGAWRVTSWTGVQVNWFPFLNYVRQNLIPSEVAAAPKAAGRKPTAKERVLAYIEETFSNQIPPHVTNEAIARAVGVNEKTVRRARGRG
jgi:hypothetical protein